MVDASMIPMAVPSPVAELPGRLEAVEAIDGLRRALVTENPLGPKNQVLVHFGQLVVVGHGDAAACQAIAARRSGATPPELIGVVETALLVAGMPAYKLGITILSDLFSDDTGPET